MSAADRIAARLSEAEQIAELALRLDSIVEMRAHMATRLATLRCVLRDAAATDADSAGARAGATPVTPHQAAAPEPPQPAAAAPEPPQPAAAAPRPSRPAIPLIEPAPASPELPPPAPSPRRGRIWTPEQRAAQRERMRRQIAAGRMGQHARRKAAAAEPPPVAPSAALPPALGGLQPEEIEEARQMLRDGKAGRDLAAHFGWPLGVAAERAALLRQMGAVT